jgi:hypothetical protein
MSIAQIQKLGARIKIQNTGTQSFHTMAKDNSEQSNKKQTNSRAFDRQRTIPSERPPLVGDVSANFSE